jgi:thioredoxin 1
MLEVKCLVYHSKGNVMAVSITSKNLESEVKKSDKPVVLDIFATWCGPCQQMAPIFEELEKEMGGKYKFAKLNVDEARDVSIEYGVTSVPTFIFIHNGAIKGRETGYMGKDALVEKIKKYLG